MEVKAVSYHLGWYSANASFRWNYSFASTALDGTVWTFPHLVERVIQNNTTTIFLCALL